jgi:hypothetical protein
MDLLGSTYFIEFLNIGEKYARFITDSPWMSACPTLCIHFSAADIRIFALKTCFLSQRTLFPGTSFFEQSS